MNFGILLRLLSIAALFIFAFAVYMEIQSENLIYFAVAATCVFASIFIGFLMKNYNK
jgi:hypothetical protein